MAMDKEREALMRERFEQWITAPPFEKNIMRYSEKSSEWPGCYRDYAVHLAWDAWQAALTAQQEPVAWMWLEGTELLNGTEVEQFERVEFSREKPDYDAYGLTPLYTAPPSGVQPADGRASMQAELGAALGSALSHYKSGDMQACAASLVRIVDLFRGAAKEPR